MEKTIELKAATTQMLSKLIESLTNSQTEAKKLQEQAQEVQRQFNQTQDNIKSFNGKVEGLILGILTLEGVDLDANNISLKPDLTGILIVPKNVSGDLAAEAVAPVSNNGKIKVPKEPVSE